MNKHDLQQYAGIIVLCLGIVSGLYAFTAYIDRKADAHYAQNHKIDCKAIINELELSRSFKVSDLFKEPHATQIRKVCDID